MASIRVLHVISGLDAGGAESLLYRLCMTPGREGDIVVSLTGEGVHGPKLRTTGHTVHALGMRRNLAAAALVPRLAAIIREARPDVVQTWLYHGDLIGGLAARLAGVRHVAWGLHNADVSRAAIRGSTRAVARLSAVTAGWIPERIVSSSRAAARVHAALGYPADKMTVIANGYDVARFAPDAAARQRLRAELGLGDGVVAIGFGARFDPQKDFANFLDAYRIVAGESPAVRAVMFGQGVDPANAMLARLIGERGLSDRIDLLGLRDDVPALMNAIDLFVLSSASESFPNVIAEAMASGTPVVATDVGDVADIVGETGWIVPPRNSAVLAAAILDALRERDNAMAWRARQAAARRRIVDNFRIERMAKEYLDLWTAMRAGAAPVRNRNECAPSA